MYDLTIRLNHKPGSLADMGEALGKAGVSIEGGGAFAVNNEGIAHFLFEDGTTAQNALEQSGIEVLACRKVLVQKLRQDIPGQLGQLTRRMANAGVNIEVLYSDHSHQLILVVDDYARGEQVSLQWQADHWTHEAND